MDTDCIMRPILPAILIGLCLCASCGVQRQLQSDTVQVRDSVVVSIRDSVAIRFDTVAIEIPVESHSALLASSDSSHLETALATSDAWTDSLGLHHTLENKAGKLEKEVAIPEHYHSETTEAQHQEAQTITVTEYVERDFTWLQTFWMTSGKVLWALLAGAAVFGIIKLAKIL